MNLDDPIASKSCAKMRFSCAWKGAEALRKPFFAEGLKACGSSCFQTAETYDSNQRLLIVGRPGAYARAQAVDFVVHSRKRGPETLPKTLPGRKPRKGEASKTTAKTRGSFEEGRRRRWLIW